MRFRLGDVVRWNPVHLQRNGLRARFFDGSRGTVVGVFPRIKQISVQWQGERHTWRLPWVEVILAPARERFTVPPVPRTSGGAFEVGRYPVCGWCGESVLDGGTNGQGHPWHHDCPTVTSLEQYR